MTLGEKIRDARKHAGLTQDALAEKLSVSRSAVAKWETDKGLPDIDNLKALSGLLSVSVDYLLDDQEEKELSEIRESICLEDYQKTRTCRCPEDAVVLAKYPDADSIHPLIRQKKLSRVESILDFFTFPGVFDIADRFADTSAYYFVERNGEQYLVNVSKEFITSTRLARRITEKKFTIGKNIFRKAEYTVNK